MIIVFLNVKPQFVGSTYQGSVIDVRGLLLGSARGHCDECEQQKKIPDKGVVFHECLVGDVKKSRQVRLYIIYMSNLPTLVSVWDIITILFPRDSVLLQWQLCIRWLQL